MAYAVGRWRSLAFAALLGLIAVAPAGAANWLEKGIYMTGPRYDGMLPDCEAALSTVAWRFAANERQFWNSNLFIISFERVRETAFRPWASDNIPRRYCTGEAMLTDGKMRKVHFSIVEDGGFAGYGQGVEWCVVGVDRNWAYNPACRAAKP